MKKYTLLFLVILGFLSQEVLATHIRAGEITLKRTSATSLTYLITVTTYTDDVGGRDANDQQTTVKVYFGDGTFTDPEAPRISQIGIGNNTIKNIYQVAHTFPSVGNYIVSCGIQNRNADIKNIPNSVGVAFFVETTVVINDAIGVNSTPILLNAPVDFLASVGQRWIHNPNAFDVEGDSLAYRLSTPKNLVGLDSGTGAFIAGYRTPQNTLDGAEVKGKNEDGLLDATFTIDKYSGDLIWDAPAYPGQYNAAFIVEEWRKGVNGYVKISETVRDMQIVVSAIRNNRPRLIIPNDLCVEAGQLIEKSITATDKDNDRVTLTATGAMLLRGDASSGGIVSNATFSPLTIQNSPATSIFTWGTNCTHIRDKPFEILLKVQDSPTVLNAPRLVDSKIWKIRVALPTPKGLKLINDIPNITNKLSWDAHFCNSQANSKYVLYRKEIATLNSCPTDIADVCNPQKATSNGYTKIATLDNTVTNFDDTPTTGLKIGKRYSYVLSYMVSQANGIVVESAYSNAVCGSLALLTPLSVDIIVTVTDPVNGVVKVSWAPLRDESGKPINGNYYYELLRSCNGEPFKVVAKLEKQADGTIPTTYEDKNLDTKNSLCTYKVVTKLQGNDGAIISFDESLPASIIEVKLEPAGASLDLSWKTDFPWETDTLIVYRENPIKPGIYNIIFKTTDVTLSQINDDGLDRFLPDGNTSAIIQQAKEYCYYVVAKGTYKFTNGTIIDAQGRSKIICAEPIPYPICTSTLGSIGIDHCKEADIATKKIFSNKITWTYPVSGTTEPCDQRINSFKVFYSRYRDETAKEVASLAPKLPLGTTVQEFIHTNLTQPAGCYYIVATNARNQTTKSEVKCKETCLIFELPNVITPNGDGKNDVFKPLTAANLVNSVLFNVYTRDGVLLFNQDGTSEINWKGVNNGGVSLNPGSYFYDATAVFKLLDSSEVKILRKGIVEIIK